MTEDEKHWLVRRKTIRILWIVFGAILALTAAASLLIPIKGHFEIDGLFAFFAVFGFVACVIMVVVAKALGIFLKRPDDYYGD